LIAKRYKVSASFSKNMIEMVSDVIMHEIAKGNKVCFGKMGYFEPKVMKEKTTFNPTKKERLLIPSMTRTRFRESVPMKRLIHTLS
jgi:nucleoid DNA-binding protein